MCDVFDFDVSRYESMLRADTELSTGPRNLDSVDFDLVDTNRVSGKDLRPLTQDRAKTLIQKCFPSHFDWVKPPEVSLTPDSTRQPEQNLFFAMVVEQREASWRSPHGITRDFDSVFHCLDKWSAETPAITLDSASLEKTVEFEWTRTQGELITPIKAHCMCWEHSSGCLSCKGIASVE